MSIQAGSYGFVLTLETGLDLTNTTSLYLAIRAPRSTAVAKAIPLPEGILDAAAGKAAYQVSEGDFPVPGTYTLQVIDASTGRRLYSRVLTLLAEANVPVTL